MTIGDFRRFVGENPNKIKNVVSTQINNFNLLYSSLIQALPNVTFVSDNNLQVIKNIYLFVFLLTYLSVHNLIHVTTCFNNYDSKMIAQKLELK